MTYKIPTRQDIGELHTAFVESYEPKVVHMVLNLLVKLSLIQGVPAINMP